MNRPVLLIAALLLTAPLALAHKPPGPVLTCQPYTGEQYHDYIPPVINHLIIAGDGNLADCGPNNISYQILSDNGARCQQLKQIRDDPASPPELAAAAALLHTELCTERVTPVSQAAADYDGEYDYGHGGVLLAVNTGDMATHGAYVCYGMTGHHSANIYAQEWPSGQGPAMIGTSDFSRTPPAAGPKSTPADCGDGFVEPCDSNPPPPSTQPFPVNVVIDTVNAQLWALFGPAGDGTTCNLDDCAVFAPSNPTGPSHLVMPCPPGIDGAYWIFVLHDPNAPMVTSQGHVWTY